MRDSNPRDSHVPATSPRQNLSARRLAALRLANALRFEQAHSPHATPQGIPGHHLRGSSHGPRTEGGPMRPLAALGLALALATTARAEHPGPSFFGGLVRCTPTLVVPPDAAGSSHVETVAGLGGAGAGAQARAIGGRYFVREVARHAHVAPVAFRPTRWML